MALEPNPTGQIVAVSSFVAAAPAGQAAAAAHAAAGALPAKTEAEATVAAAASDPTKKSATGAGQVASAGQAVADPAELADGKARMSDAKAVAVAAAMPKSASAKGERLVVNAVATPADAAALTIEPASFVKADNPRGQLDQLIAKYAAVYEVPVDLVRRVVKRESNFNPSAFNRGHYGLMQIKHATARGMGYQGSARGLFDAETNLKYSVKYLRGAFMVAGGDHNRADRLYQSGYYYHAKRQGLLDETGLGKDRVRRRAGKAVSETPPAVAVPPAPVATQ